VECLSAQQGHVTLSHVRDAREEVGDSGELVGIETPEERTYLLSHGVEDMLDVPYPLERWVQDLLTPIVRIRLTTNILGPLQPPDDTGDRAAGQPSDRGQLAAGHRPALA
jgi:hypothetical protein